MESLIVLRLTHGEVREILKDWAIQRLNLKPDEATVDVSISHQDSSISEIYTRIHIETK